jgi:hypothetical protein
MQAVKVAPRFRCDYCRRVSTKAAMAKHEARCFFNPNRKCPNCKDTAHCPDIENGAYVWKRCSYCEKALVVLGDYAERDDLSPEVSEALDRLDDRLSNPPSIPASAAFGEWDRAGMTLEEFTSILRAHGASSASTFGQVPNMMDDYDPFSDDVGELPKSVVPNEGSNGEEGER